MIVEVKNVTKTYYSGKTSYTALHGVSLSVEKGEFTAIAGASGSGKTTLFNLIGCLDSFNDGDIFIDGKSIKGMNAKESARFRRENLGFVFQNYNLIPVLTVMDNITLPLALLKIDPNKQKEMGNEILEKVGLKDLGSRFPLELSGGQQQRVSIARALIKRPKLVLADEPTANLDSTTGEDILNLMALMNQNENITFLFSTHDKRIMKKAHKVHYLSDGVLEEIDEGALI